MLLATKTAVLSSYFSPLSIPNLKLWLHPQNVILSNSGGTITVQEWKDSRNNISFSVNTKAYQPLYVPSALNGKPGLLFDGLDDGLQTSSIAGLNLIRESSAATMFAVIKPLGIAPGSNFNCVFYSAVGNSHSTRIRFGINNLGLVDLGGRRLDSDQLQSASNTSAGVSLNSNYVFSSIFNFQAARLLGYDRSKLIIDSLFQTPGLSSATTSLSCGVGSVNLSGFYFYGYIYELFIYSTFLSYQDILKVTNYLAKQWGI